MGRGGSIAFTPASPDARAAERTTIHVQRLAVAFDYPVVFTRGLFDPLNPVLADALSRLEPEKRHRFAAFVDDGVASRRPDLGARIAAYAGHHGRGLELLTEAETVPGGERAKNDPALVERLHRRILELGIDRHSFVVAIGGGAVLDAVGFAAATAHRGVRLVRAPTTVLAQADGGVGVKNGVNAHGVKNFLGTFQPPFAVLNDLDFLATLSPREGIAGLAEAVKVALVRDRAFFLWLEANWDRLAAGEPAAVEFAVRRSADLHLRHIAEGGDPFERGAARPLDFGHWAAHKLETATRHALSHGEAVAIGMALDARYAVLTGVLAAGGERRICRLLERLGFRLWHPVMDAWQADGATVLLDGLREFREHLGGEPILSLPARLGRGVDVPGVDLPAMRRALTWLGVRDSAR